MQKDGSPAAFHEVIVLFPDNLDAYDLTRPQAIIEKYIRMRRADNALILSNLKMENGRIQIDFLISDNEIQSTKLISKSPALFRSIASYPEAKYPELKKLDKETGKSRKSQKFYHLNKSEHINKYNTDKPKPWNWLQKLKNYFR